MFVSSPTIRRLPSLSSHYALASVLLAVVALHPVLAQGTHLWTQSRLEEFEKGTPQGVSLTSDGNLREGPALIEKATTLSTYVWTVAADKSGTAYVGTAAPATVLRIGMDGKPFTIFETKDISVQVVRLGPDGALYAATMPGGKVFKLKADATAKQDESSAIVVFDASKLDDMNTTGAKPAESRSNGNGSDAKSSGDKGAAKSHYIWDLTFDTSGRLYIAMGGPGAVYRVDPSKPGSKPEEFFHSDEQHIRALAWDGKGNLIAGSDGSGLIYRIDAKGKGYVLFDAPRREITAVAVAANGTIYAANVGEKNRNPLPPLPVQGIPTATMTIMQPGSMQTASTSASLPEGSEIFALTEGQAPRKLWTDKDEIVYALAVRSDGLVALTGNRGRVFKIADDGSYADIAHLEAVQVLSFAVVPNSDDSSGILIGTGNTGKLYGLAASASKHEYASDVLDAGSMAHFGRVEFQPGSAGYELWTRSGNVEQPVRGWSDWEPLKEGAVASPNGRFLQWKAVLRAGGTVGGVGVNYLPVNAAPVVDELVVVPGARLNPQNQFGGQQQVVNITFPSPTPNPGMNFDASAAPLAASKDRTAITARWAVHDDNGDDLTYAVYLRGDGETVWRKLKDGITEKAYSFDANLIPDGGYQIKIIASDAPAHSPGEALTGAKESERFEVDTTPPVINGLKGTSSKGDCRQGRCEGLQVSFDAEDAFSPIARAEYSLDAGTWQFVEPVGKLSDSKREHYELHIPLDASGGKIGEHLITVRAYDRHDNVGVAKTVIAAPEK